MTFASMSDAGGVGSATDTQGAWLVVTVDAIPWRSAKVKRKVSSMLARETPALSRAVAEVDWFQVVPRDITTCPGRDCPGQVVFAVSPCCVGTLRLPSCEARRKVTEEQPEPSRNTIGTQPEHSRNTTGTQPEHSSNTGGANWWCTTGTRPNLLQPRKGPLLIPVGSAERTGPNGEKVAAGSVRSEPFFFF